MKKTIKVISLMLAVLMLGLVSVACTSEVAATVTISFVGPDGENLLNPVQIQVIGTSKEPPTALMAAEQVLQKYDKAYSLTSDNNSLASAFDLTNEQTEDATTGYYSYWNCTVNGQESSSGRQSATAIYGGDVVVFTFTSGSKDREDTVAEETTDPSELETSVIETEPEETEETSDEAAE